MREEGLQARGAYKEVPRASRRLALATPESPWACTRVRAKITLTDSEGEPIRYKKLDNSKTKLGRYNK